MHAREMHSAAVARRTTLRMHRCAYHALPHRIMAAAILIVEMTYDISVENHAPTHQQRLETLKDICGHGSLEISSERIPLLYRNRICDSMQLKHAPAMYLNTSREHSMQAISMYNYLYAQSAGR